MLHGLPKGIFQHDICTIEESADYLILAVRLPKQWIRDNHALLMALSEACTERRADAA